MAFFGALVCAWISLISYGGITLDTNGGVSVS